MEQSILKSTKKILGVNPDDPAFDLDIITHINSVFSILRDLGVGPETGFSIEDGSKIWSDFVIGDGLTYDTIKSYVYIRVRLFFDPPQTMFLLEAFNKQVAELEWRISSNREARDWVAPPVTTITPEPSLMRAYLEGGHYE